MPDQRTVELPSVPGGSVTFTRDAAGRIDAAIRALGVTMATVEVDREGNFTGALSLAGRSLIGSLIDSHPAVLISKKSDT